MLFQQLATLAAFVFLGKQPTTHGLTHFLRRPGQYLLKPHSHIGKDVKKKVAKLQSHLASCAAAGLSQHQPQPQPRQLSLRHKTSVVKCRWSLRKICGNQKSNKWHLCINISFSVYR